MNFKFYDTLDEGTKSLVDWQYHRCGGFYTSLWYAISQADEANLDKLEQGFPLHVKAYRNYTTVHGWWQHIERMLEV